MVKYLIIVILFISFNGYSETYTHKLSDGVKIVYQKDGLVKIISTDKGKQNHHFSLKLDNLNNNNHHINLGVPLSLSKKDNSIIYHWNNEMVDEWQLVDNNIVRKLTIDKKPKIKDVDNELIINSFFKTDLGFLTTGGYPYSFSKSIMDHESLNNLRIDETSYYVIDANCKQLIVDKDFDDKNHKLDYNLDKKNIKGLDTGCP